MLRWLTFCFGGLLLITTLVVRDYRANHGPDSTSLAILEDDPIDEVHRLVRVDMKRQQTVLFSRVYGDFLISYFEWSPNGKWILVVIGDDIYIINPTGEYKRKLYQSDDLYSYPRWPSTISCRCEMVAAPT